MQSRPSKSRAPRLLGLAACIAAVAVLGAGGPAWATSSLAQTVPTITKSPTTGPSPTATSALPSPTFTPSPAPPTATLTPGRLRPTSTPTATSAAPSVTPAPEAACAGGARAAGASPNAAPKSLGARYVRAWLFAWPDGAPTPCRLTLALLPALRLPGPPAGWRLASGGVRLAAVDAAGQPLAAAGRMLICFQWPAGSPQGEGWAVAALEGTGAARSWSRLETRRIGAAACGAGSALPATFALLAAVD